MCTLHKGPPGWIASERIARNRGLVWLALCLNAPSTTKSRPKLMSNRWLKGETREETNDPLRRQSIKINELQFIFWTFLVEPTATAPSSSTSSSQSTSPRLIVNCTTSWGGDSKASVGVGVAKLEPLYLMSIKYRCCLPHNSRYKSII